MTEPKQVLINLVTSLSLADHMGDAAEDCWEALKQVGIDVPDFSDWHELATFLAINHNATTVWGTNLLNED